MRVENGAIFWLDGRPLRISEIEASEGPMGAVRLEICVPLVDAVNEFGERQVETEIFLVELERGIAVALANLLRNQAQGSRLWL